MVTVSSKFQVVIPENVRGALGLRPGLKVDVIAKGGVAYIVPLRSLVELQAALKGLKGGRPLRDERDRPL